MAKYIITALVAALIVAGAAILYGLEQNGRYLLGSGGQLIDTRTGKMFKAKRIPGGGGMFRWEELYLPVGKQ